MRRHEQMRFHLQVGGGDQLYCDRLFHLPTLKPWLSIQDHQVRAVAACDLRCGRWAGQRASLVLSSWLALSWPAAGRPPGAGSSRALDTGGLFHLFCCTCGDCGFATPHVGWQVTAHVAAEHSMVQRTSHCCATACVVLFICPECCLSALKFARFCHFALFRSVPRSRSHRPCCRRWSSSTLGATWRTFLRRSLHRRWPAYRSPSVGTVSCSKPCLC